MPRFNRMVVNGAISDRNIFRHSVFVQVKCLQATNTKKYLLLKPHRLPYRPPYKPKKFPLEDELRKLCFSIEHSYDTATVLVDTVFYLVITVIQIVAELADVMLLSPDLRAAEKDLKELVADYHFLQEHGIHTVTDLQANICSVSPPIIMQSQVPKPSGI